MTKLEVLRQALKDVMGTDSWVVSEAKDRLMAKGYGLYTTRQIERARNLDFEKYDDFGWEATMKQFMVQTGVDADGNPEFGYRTLPAYQLVTELSPLAASAHIDRTMLYKIADVQNQVRKIEKAGVAGMADDTAEMSAHFGQAAIVAMQNTRDYHQEVMQRRAAEAEAKAAADEIAALKAELADLKAGKA